MTAHLAAQYIRMSTEKQDLSPLVQKEAIAAYAAARGMEIVATYEDDGRSGVHLKNRPGLMKLLHDVTEAKTFATVLVYDVSRWGRFQDADAAAYYEYHCRLHGADVVYVAEMFGTEANPIAALLKSMKRAMAAEYSRDLARKCRAGQHLAISRGHQMGPLPPLGVSALFDFCRWRNGECPWTVSASLRLPIGSSGSGACGRGRACQADLQSVRALWPDLRGHRTGWGTRRVGVIIQATHCPEAVSRRCSETKPSSATSCGGARSLRETSSCRNRRAMTAASRVSSTTTPGQKFNAGERSSGTRSRLARRSWQSSSGRFKKPAPGSSRAWPSGPAEHHHRPASARALGGGVETGRARPRRTAQANCRARETAPGRRLRVRVRDRGQAEGRRPPGVV